MKKSIPAPKKSIEVLQAKLMSFEKQFKTIKTDYLQGQDARSAETYLKIQLN